MDRKNLFKVSIFVYCARGIVTRLYGSLQGQILWCKYNCNEFVWQLKRRSVLCKGNCKEVVCLFTKIVYGARVIVTSLYGR